VPDDPVVRFGLAGAYLDAGKPENAADEYREAIRLKPDYSFLRRLEKAAGCGGGRE